ncbi:hypothetical protein M378DRAFT_357899 [Amanita muscaria Koide BX008]|uniref:Uncharacterized protein n=1 Tax=Amanita muscaria (strain Koide BX008) TaxID=946122 RepID=A0A0C2W9M5_AMAMK|nr:hypothetical protein M378DRAFT_357899 [Amanita muscaria Koide BX008]
MKNRSRASDGGARTCQMIYVSHSSSSAAFTLSYCTAATTSYAKHVEPYPGSDHVDGQPWDPLDLRTCRHTLDSESYFIIPDYATSQGSFGCTKLSFWLSSLNVLSARMSCNLLQGKVIAYFFRHYSCPTDII